MGSVNYFDWNMGVTDETLASGIILNPNYQPGSGQKRFFSGDMDISFTEDDDPIKNYQIIESSVLSQDNNLTIEVIPSTGSDTYTIKNCYDIKHVARQLKSNIESIISDNEIKIGFGPAITINNYDSRFTSNNLGGVLACRITNPDTNDQYLRSFTISGQNITLRTIDPINGIYEEEDIENIQLNWTFELISAFDIVKEGTDLNNTIYQGYVIKTLQNGEGTIKFTKYDAPSKATNEFIVVAYIKTENVRPQTANMISILQHDIFTDNKKIDFTLASSQLDLLKENLSKYENPLITINLKTKRPSILRRGDEVYFNVTGVYEGILKVIDYSEEYLHQNGEIKDKPLREVDYVFANYIDDFATLLSTFQLKDEINKVQLAKKQTLSILQQIFISAGNTLNTTSNIYIPIPILTELLFEDDDTKLIFKWGELPVITGFIKYYFMIGNDSGFTEYITAEVTNASLTETFASHPFIDENNELFVKMRVETSNGIGEWSNTLSIEKVSNQIIMPVGKSAGLLWNTESMIGSGTNINDLANNNDGILSNSTSWVSDSKWGYGIDLSLATFLISGNSNYKSLGNTAKFIITDVIKIKELQTSTFRSVYYTQDAPNTEFNLYYSFDSNQKLFIVIEMIDPSQTSQPSILDIRSESFNVNVNDEIGIATIVDLNANSVEFIINQSTLSSDIFTSVVYYYNSFSAFKSSGGIHSTNHNVISTISPFTLFRRMIATNSNTPTVAEIKTIFSNMGLT